MEADESNPYADFNEKESAHICKSTYDCLTRGDSSLKNFPGLLKKVILARAWERRELYKGRIVQMDSLLHLITGRAFDGGWGLDVATVERNLRADPEVLALFRAEIGRPLAEHGEIGNGRTEESRGVANTSTPTRGTTNAPYLQARIQRDCPEQLDAIMAGEKSYAQVAREQGWASRSKRVSLTGDPAVDVERLRTALGEETCRSLARTLAAWAASQP